MSRAAPSPARTRADASALAAAARARLRPVCLEWPADQFAALVADVVRFHERWDARDTLAWHP